MQIPSPELLADLYGRPFLSVESAVPGVNRTFRVRTASGAFYLRLYRKVGRSRAEIEGEIMALLAAGGNAAKPVALTTGDYVFQCPFEADSRFAVLFTEAPGAKPEPTPGNLRQIASELALLHERLRRVYPIGRPFPPETVITEACASLAALGQAFLPISDHIAELRSGICTRLQAADAAHGVCHGDVWVGNVHLLGDQTTFFDFDECFDGPIVADVARLLASIWEGDAVSFSASVEAVNAGYVASGSTLGAQDWQLAPALGQLDAISRIGFLAAYCVLEPPLWEDCLARTMQALADWSPDGTASKILHSTLRDFRLKARTQLCGTRKPATSARRRARPTRGCSS